MACIVVNHLHEFFQPTDDWAAANVTIPVLTLPLTIGAGMLARHGGAEVAFRYGCAAGLGGSCTPAVAAGGAVAVAARLPALQPTGEDRTIWVGGLPEASIEGGGSPALATLFRQFGEVSTVTARFKQGDSGNRSWALLTFKEVSTAETALAAAAAGHMVLDGAPLVVRASAVAEQLELNKQRGGGGAVAAVWEIQQSKEREWLGSLLDGLNQDADYQAAKRLVAKKFGLRAEELEENLELQEINGIQGLAEQSFDSAAGSFDQDQASSGFDQVAEQLLGSPDTPLTPRTRPREGASYAHLDKLWPLQGEV